MKIVASHKMEDCFNGSSTYRYWFDEPWTCEHIHHLQSLGKVDYYPDYPRPFFRVNGDTGLQMRGVEGESTCLTIYPKLHKEDIREDFEQRFAS